MKPKKFVKGMLLSVVASSMVLAGCQKDKADEKTSSSDSKTVEIDFWSAPVPQQQAFWENMAVEYTKDHPNVKINVSAMPESPTSEAGIQSAIAGGTAPTMSENVFRGFAAQLAENKAIVPLDSFKSFDETVEKRNMKNIMEGWTFSDKHQYVLPVFSNPSLFVWRTDILKEAGVNEVPKTYSEVLEAGKKLKAKYPEKMVWANADFMNNAWYKRWWDFLTLYDAASNGNAFIEGNKFVAKDKNGTEVLSFLDDLNKEGLLLSQKSTDPFETGLSVATQMVPFKFKALREKYPDLKEGQNFAVASPPVPDGVSTEDVKTVADSKGLVIYATATKEQQQAAFDFANWVFSDIQHDVKWLETTNLIPARDNLDDKAFDELLNKYTELKTYANSVKNSVPAIDNANFVDIQTAIGDKGLIPVLQGKSSPKDAWNDVKKNVESAIK
ncbi:extracellular solute-binding protein [Neobacillus sp. MM2021_6]|uniref:ABC transporter substrate-binding protein n=1 Tax=Bacillaceae TaxID=186817 RepID=UPI00140B3AC0|nr:MULTISPECIES: extracellular solute-binding protein [Bacillaceae]MBO0959907.1 extracellular solute-binding protein [Neobacillus sp. MM2021_6]NHC18855.1 extracellular solute-binding protein [Bacillus sp. MM2020_4]